VRILVTAEEAFAELRIADEIATDEAGAAATTAGAQQFQAFLEDSGQHLFDADGSDACAASEHVGVAVRKGDEVAGDEVDGGAVMQMHGRAAFAEQVVDDDVSGVAGEDGSEDARLRRGDAPGLGELAVEVDGGVELDHTEDFGERIHTQPRRTYSKGPRTMGQTMCACRSIHQVNRTRG